MSNFKHPTTAGGPAGGGSRGDRGTIFIGSLDDTGLTVEAQYNPKELSISKSVPWQKKNQANKTDATGIQLEFNGAEGRTMDVELLFDGYEQKASVAGPIAMLNEMASVIDPLSNDENQRRPHLCVCTWGSTVDNFKCVISKLTAKYTMFGEDGTPLRATCTVSLMEADAVSKANDSAAGTTPSS